MHSHNLPAPIQIDKLADILATAQQHHFTDHGQTRFHLGTSSDGRPFAYLQNTADGLGFELVTA